MPIKMSFTKFRMHIFIGLFGSLIICSFGQMVTEDAESNPTTEQANESTEVELKNNATSSPSPLEASDTKAENSLEPEDNKVPMGCEQLQQCQIEKDENMAQVLGILERKLVKLEKKNSELKEYIDKELTSKLDNLTSSCDCGGNKEPNSTIVFSPEMDQSMTIQPKSATPSPPPSSTTMAMAPENDNKENSPTPTTPQESNKTENYFSLKTLGANAKCFDGSSENGEILIKRCNPKNPAQDWMFNNASQFINKANQQCLESGGETGLRIGSCNVQSPTQMWALNPDNTISQVIHNTPYCLSTGSYFALASECDGESWQQYDYWSKLQAAIPQYYLVTIHF